MLTHCVGYRGGGREERPGSSDGVIGGGGLIKEWCRSPGVIRALSRRSGMTRAVSSGGHLVGLPCQPPAPAF